MNNNRVILAGGSGFLGRALARTFHREGREVVVFSRNPDAKVEGATVVRWDGRTLGDWVKTLDGAAVLINLTGRNVNCRYHADNRREILESRVDSIHVLGEAIRKVKVQPVVWIQSGTVAIYGDSGEVRCDESLPARAGGFSPDVAHRWEEAFQKVHAPGIRKVLARISFVLGRDEGAMKFLAGMTRLGLGGTVGKGQQYVSWIHVHDLVRSFQWMIRNQDVIGMYHVTAPHPVRNREFMKEIRSVVHRSWSPPVPEWMVPFGCWLLGTEPELALRSRYAVPGRLLKEKFEFQHPYLKEALQDLYQPQTKGKP